MYHYLIRSFNQLKKHIFDRVNALKSGVPMGGHIKHWFEVVKSNSYEEEWKKYFFNECEIKCLEKLLIIQKDDTMEKLFLKYNLV